MDDYRAKRTLFEAELTFAVDAGALVRSVRGGAAQQIALGDVRKVALIYQPSLSDRWVCVVEGGGVRISIPSASFIGPGRTEDRRTAFRAFVSSLNLAIAAAAPAGTVSYVQGSLWSRYSSLAFLICFAILAVLLVLGGIGTVMEGGGAGALGWITLPSLVTLMAARITLHVWRGNRRRTYDPAVLPADFAPLR